MEKRDKIRTKRLLDELTPYWQISKRENNLWRRRRRRGVGGIV